MLDSRHPDELRPFARGSYISRPVINALINYVRGQNVPRGNREFGDTGPGARRRDMHARDELSWHRCESDDDVDEFSIVEVYDARLDTYGRVVLIVREAAATATSSGLYAGNEAYPLYAGSSGWVKLITPYDPVIVNVSESSDPIVFGDNLVADGFKVSMDASGLLLAVTAESTLEGSGTAALGTGVLVSTKVAVLAPMSQALQGYIVTQKRPIGTGSGTGSAVEHEDTAIWRDADPTFHFTDADDRAKVIDAKRAQRNEASGRWAAIEGAETESIGIDALHGVLVTGDTMFVSNVGGFKNWVSGYSCTYFTDCTVEDDIPPNGTGYVSLDGSGGMTVITHNTLGPDTLSAGEFVTVQFNDHSQLFDIIKVGCPL